MPVYEFYCPDCHALYQFLSRRVDTQTLPACPACPRPALERRVSLFAVTGHAAEPGAEEEELPADEAKLEQAMMALADEAADVDDEDPRQAARLMQRLAEMTGMEMGPAMREAMGRLEAGEDPDQIEEEMGEALDGDPFLGAGEGARRGRLRRALPPRRDETLYEM